MNNHNAINLHTRRLAIVLTLILSIFGFKPAMAKKKNRYVAMERVLANNPELDLFINEKSQSIDLARTQNIRVRIKARDLFNSIDRTASFKISTFENTGTQRVFISSQQLSIFKGFKRSRVLSIAAGFFASPSKNLEFDVYDTAGNLINSYKTTISAINLDSQVSGSTGINIADANCPGDTFGDCQMDYIAQRFQFEAKPQRQASTRVRKTADGLYKITFPFPRNKFKFLGRKVRRKTKDDFGGSGGGSGGGATDFGETLNISTINIGDSLAESQFITYGANGELNINDNFFLDLEGKLGIGVNPPLAWLHVRNGDPLHPSIKIGAGPLTTAPVDGALEYDGSNLYFTVGSTRSILGAGGGSNGSTTYNNFNQTFNQGSVTYNQTLITFNQGDVIFNDTNITKNFVTEIYNQGNVTYNGTIFNYYDTSHYYDNGDITYNNGTIITFTNGSYMQNPVLNGKILHTNNSHTQINGTLSIPGGTQFQVLTYINGFALWRDPSAVANGGTSNFFNGTNNYFNQDITYVDNFHQYYNTITNHFNGTTNYFNQDITFVDNFHQYYNTITNHFNGTTNYFNQDITFVDNFHQYYDTTINNYNGTTNYYNQSTLFEDSTINFSNTDVLFTNGSRLIIPGGTNGQVLTYVNGIALWRNTTATVNGGTTNFSNGTSNYFNQTINFVDNFHNYFNTTILHNNTDITYNNGTVINFLNGSMLQDPVLNGAVFFTNNSFTRINGTLQIAGGSLGDVLTSDANGIASWQAPGTGHWTDIGTALHPSDLGGAETIIIGSNAIATADIELQANGGAIFNKQNGTDDFVVENSTGQAFTIEGANGNVTIGTAGPLGEDTLTLLDTTGSVSIGMSPLGAGSYGPKIEGNLLGLQINGTFAIELDVDGGSREMYINGDTVSVGPSDGTATLNVDGSFALIGAATQLVTAASGITADESYVRIAGNAGAVTLTANPQITTTATVQDGQVLILKGTSNVNTVTVIEGNGVALEGGVDFTLGDKDILQLIYDSVDSEWIEITRSDK